MWERLVLLVSDLDQWRGYLRDKAGVAPRFVAYYTVLQYACLAGIWALVTWPGIAGIAFPVPIMALVPLRSWVLPQVLGREGLAQLDVLDPRGV